MTEKIVQKNLYDYLIEYERLCLEVYIYISKTGDLLCENNPDVRIRRNQCMKEILDNFERVTK